MTKLNSGSSELSSQRGPVFRGPASPLHCPVLARILPSTFSQILYARILLGSSSLTVPNSHPVLDYKFPLFLAALGIEPDVSPPLQTPTAVVSTPITSVLNQVCPTGLEQVSPVTCSLTQTSQEEGTLPHRTLHRLQHSLRGRLYCSWSGAFFKPTSTSNRFRALTN